MLPAGPVVLGQAVLDARRWDSAPPSPPTGRPARRSRACGPRGPGRSGSGPVHAAPGSTSSVVGRVQGDRDVLAGSVAGLLDGPQDDLDGRFVGRQRRREAAFVALSGGMAVVVEDRPEGLEDLGTGAQRLRERRRAHGHDHELLEVRGVLGVLAAVEDVEHRDRERAGRRRRPGSDRAAGRTTRPPRARTASDTPRIALAPSATLVGRPVDVDQGGVDAGLVRARPARAATAR